MAIFMDRRDVVVLPTDVDALYDGINETMEYMSLVKVTSKEKSHLVCVTAQQEEIIPLLCAYYSFSQAPQEHVVRTVVAKTWRGPKEVYRDVRHGDIRFQIYPNLGYPRGTDSLIKCGNILLCSKWGYEQIVEMDG